MCYWHSRRSRKRPTLNAERPTLNEKKCQGGELNSRPRAYESPALPLSYPGVYFQMFTPSSPASTNPECFRGCSTAELPWRCGDKVQWHAAGCQRRYLILSFSKHMVPGL